ncbi:hypothetical protein HUG20_02710 [Salicibibacter cibi]|uniref:Uncharacterized protein n=1 Tax=Salicibibacter cibi TaxID=2743001 RepID=A0A7T6Z8S6_9BACI|nr:hypothetical protein [Salicibibacter cibi]QQK78921.1 hypothetical protein HUG20_02710 [Salicibibacter cibi]
MRKKISVPVRLFTVTYLLFFIGVLGTSPTSATFEDEESLEGKISSTDSFGEEDEEDVESDDEDHDEDSEEDESEQEPDDEDEMEEDEDEEE